MISVDEACFRVLAAIEPLDGIDLPLLETVGMALFGDVVADRDLPPFTNSAMDGFALRSADVSQVTSLAPARLRVIGRRLAGEHDAFDVEPFTAVRIMTGAAVPAGFDAVIPFEQVTHERDAEIAIDSPFPPGSNVRARGEDLRTGDAVLEAGTAIRPAEIALLAALGHEVVRVHARPRVAILSTGDELIGSPVHSPSATRIHDSNGPMLAALVEQAGGEVAGIAQVADDRAALARWIDGLTRVDLILSSGGISAGDSDIVRDLESERFRLDVWQVAIKPGKPLAYGHAHGTPWLALPGNPVAAAVAFNQFGWPAIRKLGGHRQLHRPTVPVTLLEPIENHGGRRSFVRVWVETTGDRFTARPVGKPGSAMLSSLVQANALVIVPESLEIAEPGARLMAQLIDWPG